MTAGKLVCTPSVGSTPLRHSASFAKGKVRLSLSVPKAARGKVMRVKVEVTAARRTALGVYTYTVA